MALIHLQVVPSTRHHRIQVSPILLIFIVTPKDSFENSIARPLCLQGIIALIDSLGYLPTADGLDPSASGPVNAPPPVVVEPERSQR
jgi:hypothetical protein